MLPGVIATQTVTRVRGTLGNNGYDDQVIDWTNPTLLSLPGCSLQPVEGTEILLDRDATVSRWRLYAPPEADLASTDRVRYDGADYDVDGSVQEWPDIAGLGHKTCLLRRTSG